MGVVSNNRDPYATIPEMTLEQESGRDDIAGPHITVGQIALAAGILIGMLSLGLAAWLMG